MLLLDHPTPSLKLKIEVWAIRKRGTNEYMPARKGCRGYSFDTPLEMGGKLGPRLFPSKLAARNALTAWALGEFHNTYESHLEYGSEFIGVEVKPGTARDKSQMELVRFSLVEERAE